MRSLRNECRRVCAFAGVFLFATAAVRADNASISRAVTQLQNGDFVAAEATLRNELKTHPNEPEALEVLAVVLDQEHKTADASAIYRKAVALDSQSPSLLNNYGNHLLSSGKLKEAQAQFLKVESLQPDHPNATLQLARIALESKHPAEADHYLSKLGPEQLQRPDVVTLRMQTDYELHRDKEADVLLERLTAAAAGNAENLFHLGVALSSAGQYARAETLFGKALELSPGHVEIMHDLGLAASHAGHDEHAREVMTQALERKPDDIDLLYDLAAVDLRLHDGEAALALLVRASQAAPDRADVAFALAHAAADLGYFGDALHAWQAYIRLAPKDNVGRREYAFTETALGENTSSALSELQNYLTAHPADPIGHYELAVALLSSDRSSALQHLDRALALKPDFAAAHLTRGLIESRAGDLVSGLKDFQTAVTENPKSAVALDHLGETQLQMGQPGAAVQTLKEAEQIAPDNTTILLHLGRALAQAGDNAGSSQVLARYRDLGGPQSNRPHGSGLVAFLGLSPQEQQKRYRAGVMRTLQNDPNNLDAEIQYLGLLLQDGKIDDAAALSEKLAGQLPDSWRLHQAAMELLDARAYKIANKLLSQTASVHSTELTVDRSMAALHLAGAAAANSELDLVPASERNGDYDLARADALYAATNPQKGNIALQEAARERASRLDLFCDLTLRLISQDEIQEAEQLINAAPATFSEDAEWSVITALVQSLLHKNVDSTFAPVENRWPEWAVVSAAKAIAVAAQTKPDKGADRAALLASVNTLFQSPTGNR